MATRPSTSMVLTALLLSVAIVATESAGDGGKETGKPVAEDLVAEACKNMSADLLVNKEHLDEEPCVSALRSDSRSTLAKDHGDLVVIAMDLLDQQCNKAVARIDGMLRDLKVHNWTERAFQFCSADYAAMVRSLPACRDIFSRLKPFGKNVPCRLPDDGDDALLAFECLDRVGQAARDCSVFLANHWDDDRGVDEFDNVVRHVSLAWGLMEMATNCRDDYSGW